MRKQQSKQGGGRGAIIAVRENDGQTKTYKKNLIINFLKKNGNFGQFIIFTENYYVIRNGCCVVVEWLIIM